MWVLVSKDIGLKEGIINEEGGGAVGGSFRL